MRSRLSPSTTAGGARVNVYVGQTRSAKLIAELSGYGFGEMACRGELPPRRAPWAFDNGAFGDWKAGRPFDGERFWQDVEVLERVDAPPDFLVCPDIVAGGVDSLAFSLTWRDHLAGICPLYLAVQDGMAEEDVAPHAKKFAGIFVGGTLPWKIRAARDWVRFAHARGLRVHIGRVGTERRVAWARRIGADSIDSCLPLWSTGNLRSFLRGLGPRQPELALEVG